MTRLLYCIFNTQAFPGPLGLTGVDDRPLSIVASNGLAAVVSTIVDSDGTLTLDRIKAYERVIEKLHENSTVIPMRYGCLFHETSQIVRLLEVSRRRYMDVLREIDGCVEMGVRVLAGKEGCGAAEREDPSLSPLPGNRQSPPSDSGGAYLASRKLHYHREDRMTLKHKLLGQKYEASLSGLYVKSRMETCPRRNTILPVPASFLSMHFLVKRSMVGEFRAVFREIVAGGDEKALLTGPWPPYNFVVSDELR